MSFFALFQKLFEKILFKNKNKSPFQIKINIKKTQLASQNSCITKTTILLIIVSF